MHTLSLSLSEQLHGAVGAGGGVERREVAKGGGEARERACGAEAAPGTGVSRSKETAPPLRTSVGP